MDGGPAVMTPAEFAARMAELPSMRSIVEEHLEDELLIHLLMSDLLRGCVRAFGVGELAAASAILQVVEEALLHGDDDLENAVGVSFVEHAGSGEGETEAFLAIWPPGLMDELARQRQALRGRGRSRRMRVGWRTGRGS